MAIRWDDLEFDDEPSDVDLWFAAMAEELPHAASPFLGLVDEARPVWHQMAACRDHPELDWFAAKDQAATTVICDRCPVVEPCAEAGQREAFGLWGGQARRMAGGRAPVVRAAPQAPRWCSHCGSERVRAKGLCIKCYQYRRWSGRDRPEHLIVAANVLRHEAEAVAKRAREATLRAEVAEEWRRK